MADGELVFEVETRPDRTPDEVRDAALAAPRFGAVFTDHMALAHWTPDDGWHDAVVTAYRPLEVSPAAAVLHYAQEIRVDQAWVPPAGDGEASLYLRPFMIAVEPNLAVRPSRQVTYGVIASPAGPYFPGGIAPVSIWLATNHTRAAHGGTGEAKCGGNYAASLAAQAEAVANGCDQVAFLDAAERTWVEESGSMNLCFVYRDGRIVTPELSGAILDGITRASILELATGLGHQVEERRVSIDEWRDGVASGDITEVFACGTAAVVTPVGRLVWDGGEAACPPGVGPVTARLRTSLLDLQYGRTPDDRGWLTRLA